ncbi:MAG: phosphotyrosine protein phosphatase [Pseudomonadota bacterium]
MNILFLCTANVQRSKTAEELFQVLYPENTYKSAGLSAKYVTKAGSTLCTEDLLNWADKIYVFEQAHIERIEQYTKSRYVHKVSNLDIHDEYSYFQKELVLMLIERLAKR